jgi:hypothetical protein
MPRFDLRQDDGALDPLASFKVLAVICHPGNRVQREKMLGNILKESGVGQPRRQPLTCEEFMEQVRRVDRRAAVAGGLLLTMLQLHHNGYRASFNRAIPLVAALLPRWEQPVGPGWSKTCHFEHRPHSKSNMLQAYNHFRSVAHFWATMLHGQQHDRQDIWPGSLQTLPTFLAYAESILDMSCALPSLAHNRRFAITRSKAWSFTIPERLKPVSLEALPMNDEQLAILNEQENCKALS